MGYGLNRNPCFKWSGREDLNLRPPAPKAWEGCDLPKIKTATFFEPERDNLLSCNDGILLHKESFREQL